MVRGLTKPLHRIAARLRFGMTLKERGGRRQVTAHVTLRKATRPRWDEIPSLPFRLTGLVRESLIFRTLPKPNKNKHLHVR